MKIVLLHAALEEAAGHDDLDVLEQCAAIRESLARLGHTSETIPVTLDLERLRQSLITESPDSVFNLVESLAGTDRLMPLVPLLLESLAIRFTGASVAAIFDSGDKIRAKQRLYAAGLPTPAWFDRTTGEWNGSSTDFSQAIVKCVYEHASFQMDDLAVVNAAPANELKDCLALREQKSGRPWFAEQFVAGREFNLSLLEQAGQVTVLPPAEIDFSSFPTDKPRIVGYAAKWHVDSAEYHQTPRRFEFPETDQKLLQQLCSLAIGCWNTFCLSGYARVDFRVSDAGDPFILEVNANPCLSRDAGFAAALEQAKIGYDEAIAAIISERKTSFREL